MKLPKYTKHTEHVLECAFYLLVFATIAVFAILQPFGVPPDEINRYKVVQYICIHGKLPIGSDPEVIIGGYGASYAFQPILSYIIMGFIMRPIFQFSQDSFVLAYVARFVNVFIGVIMAYFVRKIAKEVFDSPVLQWLFTLLVVLLPQNLFLHSYVNTDSMAALATAIIIYACIRGMKTAWNTRACITLAMGIILCALSYYNAYSVILCSILLFLFSFMDFSSGKMKLRMRPMLQKGIFISAMVLLGIGWWFIRNAILYDGDFIGMTARMKSAAETCIPMFHPDLKETIQSAGYPITYLFRETLFLHTLYESFIATFGTMDIFTYPWIYTVYRVIFAGSLLCLLLPLRGKLPTVQTSAPENTSSRGTVERPSESITETYLRGISNGTKQFFNVLMFLDMVIVAGLCVWYSYSWDYQPQGRYVLPLLIPLMYFISVGISKLDAYLTIHVAHGKQIALMIEFLIITFVIAALASTMLGSVIPYYRTHDNWLRLALQSW
ncbi:MAG: hypothetical protein PHE02_04170 [Lachnospiraceae bacterium]|nr:hypothetical protein [Lachnospiraceae bacterium]